MTLQKIMSIFGVQIGASSYQTGIHILSGGYGVLIIFHSIGNGMIRISEKIRVEKRILSRGILPHNDLTPWTVLGEFRSLNHYSDVTTRSGSAGHPTVATVS